MQFHFQKAIDANADDQYTSHRLSANVLKKIGA